jgi:hypothetical protein
VVVPAQVLNELLRGNVMAVRCTSAEWYLLVVAIVWVHTTFRTGYYDNSVSKAAFTCLSDPMAMARAQEMQEWDWEMENGHGGATHIFVMAGLHVK